MSYFPFPPSRPREAKGGIKARNKRGAFAESWWGRRWLEVLESFDIGARLSRGRSYARKGQVLDLAIAAGKVTAKVQGSRPAPYRVKIDVKPIAAREWRTVGEAVAADTWSAARLIAGEMPEGIEAIFKAAGVPLFPARLGDLTTDCSCPDWSNPCKHVAAVYYLLAEAFDRDPFLLFRLRGCDREAFVALLGEAAPGPGAVEAPPPAPPQPLTADRRAFWQGLPLPDDGIGGSGAAVGLAGTVPLAATLGPLPFWRGEADFLDAVTDATDRARPRGLALVLGRIGADEA